MANRRLIYRVHALKRMFERGISSLDVRRVLEDGEVIEDYPADLPYPSRLVLARINNRPLHVVAADDLRGEETYIITAYEPDPLEWDQSFRRRK